MLPTDFNCFTTALALCKTWYKSFWQKCPWERRIHERAKKPFNFVVFTKWKNTAQGFIGPLLMPGTFAFFVPFFLVIK